MRWGLARINETDFPVSAIFDDFFRMVPSGFAGEAVFPRLDVHEDDKAVYIRAEIPGMEEKDLDLTLKENVLTISGEKKEEKTEGDKNKNYWYCERAFGSFSRTITLPDGVNGEEVKASYKNGVLEIELPKKESAQPRKITVQAN
jgi:HSP20 family protein